MEKYKFTVGTSMYGSDVEEEFEFSSDITVAELQEEYNRFVRENTTGGWEKIEG